MKVFIAEDSPIVQDILRNELARMDGVEICGIAKEPEDAIRSIMQEMPDLVILDIVLNNGNGFDVLKRIKTVGSKATIMMLTNYSYQHYREISWEMGADYFFDKSIEMEKALQAIQAMASN